MSFELGRDQIRISANLSNVNSSSWLRSQAIYSKAASVIRGHQDKSKERSFCRFSAINSTPSSVILLHPLKLNTVRLGNEWTAIYQEQKQALKYGVLITNWLFTNIYNAVIRQFPTRVQPEDVERIALFWWKVTQCRVRHVVRLQRKLIQGRQELGNGTNRLVRHIDAVRKCERHNTRI